jgi:hypothetical protein
VTINGGERRSSERTVVVNVFAGTVVAAPKAV